jgi:hypothetical protein
MKFEGENVDGGSKVVIRQFTGDIAMPIMFDELVSLEIVVHCTHVGFEAGKDGRLYRVHHLQVKEVGFPNADNEHQD